MNGVCGSASGTASGSLSQCVAGTSSPIRRGGPSGIGSLSGVGVGSVSGCSIPPGGQDSVRKSRSQGGKKLQKCLSTASYGEESSFNRLQMAAPLSHNLLMTRQYCSFGSTTSFILSLIAPNYKLTRATVLN